jgi:hypothetical protein
MKGSPLQRSSHSKVLFAGDKAEEIEAALPIQENEIEYELTRRNVGNVESNPTVPPSRSYPRRIQGSPLVIPPEFTTEPPKREYSNLRAHLSTFLVVIVFFLITWLIIGNLYKKVY